MPLSLWNYSALYPKSIECPDQFWGELAHKYLRWRNSFKQVMQCNMEEGDIKWFLEGKLNVSGEHYRLIPRYRYGNETKNQYAACNVDYGDGLRL